MVVKRVYDNLSTLKAQKENGRAVGMLKWKRPQEYSYTDGAVGKAAALAAQDTGSARQAIDLLRKGGEIAERVGDTTIEDKHIGDAREEVKRGRLHDKIADQSLHARHVLEAVAHVESQGNAPVRTKVVMDTYQRIAKERSDDPLTTLKSIQTICPTFRCSVFSSVTKSTKVRAVVTTTPTNSTWNPTLCSKSVTNWITKKRTERLLGAISTPGTFETHSFNVINSLSPPLQPSTV